MCTPFFVNALRKAGKVATSVFPSPVFISAIFVLFNTIPPTSWTSKCLKPNVRILASLVNANDSAINEFKF